MFEKIFGSSARVQALRDSPGGSLLESFCRELLDAGFLKSTVGDQIRAAEHFLNWTHRKGIPISGLNRHLLEGFNSHLKKCRCRSSLRSYSPRKRVHFVYCAHRFLSHLRDTGVITTLIDEPTPPDPVLLVAFRQWMHRWRGICDATLDNYSISIREVLNRLGDDPNKYDARSLRDFVIAKSRNCGPATIQTCTTGLRMFLRFLIAEGKCAASLEASIPGVAHWRLASLPRYFQPEEVERIIDSCDPTSAVGRRDRAIILLLARLGLRAGDIVQMRLSDIDWKDAWIHVCGKGRRQMRLPLSQEVGQAIVAYLQKSRPHTDADSLFVGCRAPFHAFGSHSAVSVIVNRAISRAAVRRPSRGAAHLLRHSVATSMLRQGASLQDIAAVLRHRSIDTTQIYAKVDVSALRQIVQLWPEVQPC
jgi:integrase/recombinase XerD